MSSTANALYLVVDGHRVALDLDEGTNLLVSYQANDRANPATIECDYSPEFSAPGTAHNHRLLKHAAANQPKRGAAYARVPAVLTSGGVEIMPRAQLYVKSFEAGRYQLQLAGGNITFVQALIKADGTDKMLSDLNFTRFNHNWTPANILPRLPYAYWRSMGYGYEVYDRGKPINFEAVDPCTLYPSVSYRLVLEQLLADAGFTATDLLSEPLFAALNVPTANPYTFPQPFRDARKLQAGLTYVPITNEYSVDFDGLHSAGIGRLQAFGPEVLRFGYVSRAPFHAPDAGTASYANGRFTADVLGNYDLAASVTLRFGCEGSPYPGRVRCKLQLRVNGQPIYDSAGSDGSAELEVGTYTTHTFTPKLSNVLLHPSDYVELWWEGKSYNGPTRPYWQIGPYGAQTTLAVGPVQYPGGVIGTGPILSLANEVQFTVTLLETFPEGGLVKLGDWLPEMKQLDFFRSCLLLLGLTCQADAYEPHLVLTPGNRLLSPAHVARAHDWTRKRDAAASPGRLPERSLNFRAGNYGQANHLKWLEDEAVTKEYGDGLLSIADEILPPTYDLATLPFAATLPSTLMAGLLEIRNHEKKEVTATDYSKAVAKPRLVLRRPDGTLAGKLVMVREYVDGQGITHPVQLSDFTTTVSYFTSVALSLELNSTVLTDYWRDLRSLLDQTRFITERYRLTPGDIVNLDYGVPIWDMGEYWVVSGVAEYDDRRSVEVKLFRINAAYLPPPRVPGGLAEFYEGEFYEGEFY